MSLLLAPVAVLIGAPGVLAWLPGSVIGAPLAILAALALSLLPGLALLQVLAPGRLAPAERFAAALGLSWAVPPLLLLLAEQLGLAWSAALCWLCLGACAAILLWQQLKRPVPRHAVRPDIELITLMALTALGLVVRLYAIRDLPAGLFGDSYHHTVIVQLLIDKQGLFRSWSPYAPLTTFTYHYGFHSFAAWFSWLSGVPAMASVVVAGQIAGALAVPGVFLLTRRLIPDPRVALSSALLVALVSVFPAFYVNWGRYTQLAGQTILPVTCLAWFLLIDTATTPGARWRALVRPGGLAALATAGVILGHYRVALLSAMLVLLYGLYALAVHVRSWHALVRVIGASALTGAVGALLCLPWLLRIREGQLLRLGSYFIANNIGVGTGNDQSPQQVEWALGHGLLPLAVLGIVWIVARRRWMGLLFPAWAIVAWIAANPFLIGLNGAGIVSSFAVVLAAYLVVCPLAGAGLVAIGEGLHWLLAHAWFKPRRFVPWLQALLVAGIVAWGVRYQAGIVDPQYQLLTPADVAAATWVREHVPPDARIFVNSVPAYADAVYVGTDGGWWLPLLTGRRTNLDPISYGFEAAEEPEYMQRVIERNRAVLDHPVDSVEAVAALKAGGYAYLYDGPAANPPAEYLDPARLDASPLYEPVYSAGGARIWRIR